MIEFVRGDILKAPVEALVNTVNSVGFMGRGIALQFKKAFPRNNAEYVAAVKRGEVAPGRMLVHRTQNLSGPAYVINFPTKRHWRGPSRLEDIRLGLDALVGVVREFNISSLAIPPLGSGLGGLNWEDVRPLIVEAAVSLPGVRVLIYEPLGPADPAMAVKAQKRPQMTAGRAALVALMAQYLDGMMDATITLLEVHKLMYFLQTAGEPLKLRFTKAPYGPYADNLRHVLHAIDGYYTSGYASGGDAPDKPLAIVPGALQEASDYFSEHAVDSRRLARVAKLVVGFETPFGMELLASVQWVAGEGARTVEEATHRMYDWNDRKRRFTKEHIAYAWERLVSHGWVVGEMPTF